MKKKLKWFLGLLLLVFLGLQLKSPARTNPSGEPEADLLATNPPPPKITAMLRGACYDCHSGETHWPWYAYIAPVSWRLVKHVDEGREALNFSEWPHGHLKKERKRWQNIADELRSSRMPMKSYTWMHAAARLSAADREEFASWAEAEAARLKEIEKAEGQADAAN